MLKKINKKTKVTFLITIVGLFIASVVFLSVDFKKTEDISSVELTLNSLSPNGATGGVMIPASCESNYWGHETCGACLCAANTCIGSTCLDVADIWGTPLVCSGTLCCPNNCEATTCTTSTCWNGCATVWGSVCCPNNCAATTCTTSTCWNGCATVGGTLCCPTNSCQNSTCSTDTCWNGCNHVWGIVDCSCPLPWGGRIANKTSVTAYADPSVACGSSCSSQLLTCLGGVLSGSYVNPGCWVQPCATVSLSASRMTIGPLVASDTDLTWTTNADTAGCWGWSSNGDPLWDGGKAAGGGTITVWPAATATYNIECWNAWGANTPPASVTICVHTCGCESETCNYDTCTDNCGVTCPGIRPDHTCGLWSDCSQDCGSGGTQTRTCVCPNKTDTQACNSQPCPPSYREVTPW